MASFLFLLVAVYVNFVNANSVSQKNWTEWGQILGSWTLTVNVPPIDNAIIKAQMNSHLTVHITCDPMQSKSKRTAHCNRGV